MGRPITDYEVTEIRFTKVDNAVNGMAWNKYGQVIAKAVAKCHPEDKFDFSYGEALCNTRLIQEIARVKRMHNKDKYIMFCTNLCKVYTDSEGKDYVISDGQRYYFENIILKRYSHKPYPKDFLINGAYGIRQNGKLFLVVNGSEIYENGEFDRVANEYRDLREEFDGYDIVKIAFLKDGFGGFNCARSVFDGDNAFGEVVWERE